MKSDEFKKTLTFGEKYQEIANREIKGKMMEGHFSYYDIITPQAIKYEIKADTYTHKTGNLCIEFSSNGKDSGITITTADYYWYYSVISEEETTTSGRDGEYQLYKNIPVSYIKELIKKRKPKQVSLGYKKLSQCYLLSSKLFNEYLVK